MKSIKKVWVEFKVGENDVCANGRRALGFALLPIAVGLAVALKIYGNGPNTVLQSNITAGAIEVPLYLVSIYLRGLALTHRQNRLHAPQP